MSLSKTVSLCRLTLCLILSLLLPASSTFAQDAEPAAPAFQLPVKLESPSVVSDDWFSVYIGDNSFGWFHLVIQKGTWEGQEVFQQSVTGSMAGPQPLNFDALAAVEDHGLYTASWELIREECRDESASPAIRRAGAWNDGAVTLIDFAKNGETTVLPAEHRPGGGEDHVLLDRSFKPGDKRELYSLSLRDQCIQSSTVENIGETTLEYGDGSSVPVLEITSTGGGKGDMTFFVDGDRRIVQFEAGPEDQKMVIVRLSNGLAEAKMDLRNNTVLFDMFKQAVRNGWKKDGETYASELLGMTFSVPASAWVRTTGESGDVVMRYQHRSADSICFIKVEPVWDLFSLEDYADFLRDSLQNEQKALSGKVKKSNSRLGKTKSVTLQYVLESGGEVALVKCCVAIQNGYAVSIYSSCNKNDASAVKQDIHAIFQSVEFKD